MDAHIPKFVPVTSLRQEAANVLKAIANGQEPVVIMQRSRAVAVMISVDTYERMVREREILGLLAVGDKDIKAAKGISINQLMAEVDDELAKGSK
ncbi:type II toxin-antitoxin system Phd/YefM family antitoxin [Candidatus Bipolaricaulota bacterium]|nr:type II toxin-antitoxin system Phd/YefM family antitoxin [Candidatus Bipolaricaulota bacterium]